ncbi:hypothetical protein QF026_007471 [Streptomyces aurantiacus]|uniref:hypothetical protein n=1 Tax=Streptomyces aurantiacus TaxID=47760 RepID=UPI00279144D5|nr:hypothetical protein [Streptomyces aurantiacus]MDQ0779005.1 hypothetical protein [Streptomyces aurantiacus]
MLFELSGRLEQDGTSQVRPDDTSESTNSGETSLSLSLALSRRPAVLLHYIGGEQLSVLKPEHPVHRERAHSVEKRCVSHVDRALGSPRNHVAAFSRPGCVTASDAMASSG